MKESDYKHLSLLLRKLEKFKKKISQKRYCNKKIFKLTYLYLFH